VYNEKGYTSEAPCSVKLWQLFYCLVLILEFFAYKRTFAYIPFIKVQIKIFIWLYMLTKDEVTLTQLKQKCLFSILEWSVTASLRLY